MNTHNFHTNQPEPICKHCGLERDDHRKVQVLAESVYGSWGADYYCDGTGTEFEPESEDARERRQIQQEAEDEAKAAERMGILMGFDREEQ